MFVSECIYYCSNVEKSNVSQLLSYAGWLKSLSLRDISVSWYYTQFIHSGVLGLDVQLSVSCPSSPQ